MKILVFSEREVLRYVPTEPYIHITISEPREKLITIVNKFGQMTLYCRFHDIDCITKPYKLFDKKEAKRIWLWVNKYLKDVNLILVNCHAGISRSAGVAAALSKVLNGDDTYYFKNYTPNMFVYRTLLEEHYKNV